jgi:large subunit ribosomal protein L15
MQINELKVGPKPKRKRVGRGGKRGTYSGRGNKGQKARSGGNVNPLFEGGRSSLVERLKKLRGFKSPFPKKLVISLDQLEKKFQSGEVVSIASLIEKKIIGTIEAKQGVKVMGDGKISKKLSIEKGVLLSATAKEAIEKAGGSVEK